LAAVGFHYKPNETNRIESNGYSETLIDGQWSKSFHTIIWLSLQIKLSADCDCSCC